MWVRHPNPKPVAELPVYLPPFQAGFLQTVMTSQNKSFTSHSQAYFLWFCLLSPRHIAATAYDPANFCELSKFKPSDLNLEPASILLLAAPACFHDESEPTDNSLCASPVGKIRNRFHMLSLFSFLEGGNPQLKLTTVFNGPS